MGRTKYCHACGEPIDSADPSCPYCGARQRVVRRERIDPEIQDAASKKIAAGVCALLVGALGIHKFILGMNTPAIIMLLVTVLTCGIAGSVMGVIGMVEGIIYLTKSDEEFYELYIVEQKEWF